MYDLNIPEIRTKEPIESADHTMITFEAEAEERPFKCEKCGSLKPHVHDGGYLKQLQDIKYENKQVYISLKIQRYRCPDCRHVTSDHFSFFKKHSPLTNRLRYELVNQYSMQVSLCGCIFILQHSEPSLAVPFVYGYKNNPAQKLAYFGTPV